MGRPPSAFTWDCSEEFFPQLSKNQQNSPPTLQPHKLPSCVPRTPGQKRSCGEKADQRWVQRIPGRTISQQPLRVAQQHSSSSGSVCCRVRVQLPTDFLFQPPKTPPNLHGLHRHSSCISCQRRAALGEDRLANASSAKQSQMFPSNGISFMPWSTPSIVLKGTRKRNP